jgi:hypothetical protein
MRQKSFAISGILSRSDRFKWSNIRRRRQFDILDVAVLKDDLAEDDARTRRGRLLGASNSRTDPFLSGTCPELDNLLAFQPFL